MRIKKTSETTPLQASVVGTQSNSTTDAYSCDYINNLPNIITLNVPDINPINIPVDYQPTNVTSGYTVNSSVGTKLTLNNGVKIGKGVSKVKVSAMTKIYNNDAGNNAYLFYLIKNGGAMNNTCSTIRAYDFGTEVLPDYLLDVQENDVITIGLSCNKIISTSRLMYGYLTVEVIK